MNQEILTKVHRSGTSVNDGCSLSSGKNVYPRKPHLHFSHLSSPTHILSVPSLKSTNSQPPVNPDDNQTSLPGSLQTTLPSSNNPKKNGSR